MSQPPQHQGGAPGGWPGWPPTPPPPPPPLRALLGTPLPSLGWRPIARDQGLVRWGTRAEKGAEVGGI